MIALALLRLKALFVSNSTLVAVIAGLVAMVLTWDHARIGRAEKRGAAEVTTSMNTRTKELTDAGREARKPAALPGATERLRQRRHCRDC